MFPRMSLHGSSWANDPIRVAGGRREPNSLRGDAAQECRVEIVRTSSTAGCP